MEGGRAYSVKAYSKAMKRNIKVVVHYAESGGHKIYFSTDLEMSDKDIIEYIVHDSKSSSASGIPNSLLDSMIARQET